MTQPWNPQQYAPAPQQGHNQPGTPAHYAPPQQAAPPPQQYGAPPAAAPGPYVPPGGAAPAPYAPPQQQHAPAPYAPPQQPGYPPQAAPPQHYGGAPFQAMPPNLDSQRDPDVPEGDHVLVATGQVGIVASGRLLQVEFLVERSTKPEAIGQKGFWKCWLQRKIQGGPQAAAQAASNDIGRLVVPLSGRTKDTVDANTSYMLVGEFANRFTIEGQPIAGRRIGAHVEHKSKQKAGAPVGQMSTWVDITFHVLPTGT